jgi:putative restriction endonuclease
MTLDLDTRVRMAAFQWLDARSRMNDRYFHSLVPTRYVAAWPVYIRHDDRENLTFIVQVDDMPQALGLTRDPEGAGPPDARREYVTAVFRQRLHQQAFRERVLWAYREQCSLCRLRHQELLDAAHIVPDADPEGEPVVQNGLALCKLHHSAFDRFFLGIRPDYVIEVRKDILDEDDGPVLMHALKGMHGKKLMLPRSQDLNPDPRRLERRYELFRKAS